MTLSTAIAAIMTEFATNQGSMERVKIFFVIFLLALLTTLLSAKVSKSLYERGDPTPEGAAGLFVAAVGMLAFGANVIMLLNK
jgi:hypothetical protein